MIRKADGKKTIDGKLVAHLDRCGRMIRRAHIAILFLLASLGTLYATLSGVFMGVAARYLLYVYGALAVWIAVSVFLAYWWFTRAGKNRVGVEMIKIRYQPGGKVEEFIIVFPVSGEPPIEVSFSEFKKVGGKFKIPPVRSYKLPGRITISSFWNSFNIEMECFISISENTSPAALFRFCPRPTPKKGVGFEEKVKVALGEWLSEKCSSCINNDKVLKQLNIIGEHLRKHPRIIFGAGFVVEVRPSKIIFGGKMAWRSNIEIMVTRELLRPKNYKEKKAWKRLTPRDKERMIIK